MTAWDQPDADPVGDMRAFADRMRDLGPQPPRPLLVPPDIYKAGQEAGYIGDDGQIYWERIVADLGGEVEAIWAAPARATTF